MTLKGVSPDKTIISRLDENERAIDVGYSTPVPSDQTITIEGITIRDCWNNDDPYGGALALEGEGITVHLKNVAFINNASYDGSDNGEGGALYVYSDGDPVTVEAENCEFANNAADGCGGALYADESSGTVFINMHNCDLHDNSAYDYGGAVFACRDAYLTLEKCNFTSNLVERNTGGAVYTERYISAESSCFSDNHSCDNDGGALILYPDTDSVVNGADFTNCLFYNNHSTWGLGGAVAIEDYLPSDTPIYNFMNCTFASNSCGLDDNSGYDGGGIYMNYSGPEPYVNITNSIFWGNRALYSDTNDLYVNDYGTTTVSYSDISLPSAFSSSGTSTAVITQDPKFSSSSARSYHPADLMLTSATSLDVTAGGTFEGAPATDYAGVTRTHYSMGAYEKN